MKRLYVSESSGTGSPGFARINGCQMVVVVVVDPSHLFR